MATSRNILLVEAQSDKDFIERLIKIEKQTNPDFLIDFNVKVAIPTDFDKDERTNKDAVLKNLPIVAKGLYDGTVNRMAVIIDMDSEGKEPLEHNITKIEKSLNNDFILNRNLEFKLGLFFESKEYNSIGVWLMPNNHDDGYLETWIASCVTDKTNSHYDKAEAFIQSFQEDHFKPTSLTKAKVYTWLAIQSKPRNDLRQVLNRQLIDTNSDNYKNFIAWLSKAFID